MKSLDQARALVDERSACLSATERVSLGKSLGRRLARDLSATEPWPATDRAAMDGFALHTGGGTPAGTQMPVIGESLAGRPFSGEVGEGQAIRIMTGAVVPAGVDTVVPVELTSGFEGSTVTFTRALVRDAHIRRRGSEIAVGELLLRAGTRIRAAEIGALAVLGIDQVPVTIRPRVAILATGDEVVPISATPGPHQVRNSNTHALIAQVREAGGTAFSLGIGRDDPADIETRMRRGLEQADLLLTVGGVSKGTHDLVRETLAGLGVVEIFWGIALKPGKPTFFGERRGPEGTRFVFGLPGNPASCFTVFDLLVAPMLERMAGARTSRPVVRARLGGAPFQPNRRLQAIPARLSGDLEGGLCAELSAMRPSGDPFGLVFGQGYALIAADAAPSETPLAPIALRAGGLEGL